MGEVGAFDYRNDSSTQERCVFEKRLNDTISECSLADELIICVKNKCPIWRSMKIIEKYYNNFTLKDISSKSDKRGIENE